MTFNKLRREIVYGGDSNDDARRETPPRENARRGRREDDGSILILLLGYTVIALMLIAVLAAATGLYLAERRLVALADAAALTAAEHYDLASATLRNGAVEVPLDREEVEASVRHYIERADASHFVDLEVVSAETRDGKSVEVELRAGWSPPLVSDLIPDLVELRASSRARAALG